MTCQEIINHIEKDKTLSLVRDAIKQETGETHRLKHLPK